MKMAKRMFNDDERVLAEARLVTLDEERSHIKFLVKYNQLMVDEGLESNFKEKMRGFKKQVKIDEDELVMNEATIKTLKDQLENGVEEIVPESVE